MSEQLLDYYNQQLSYLRKQGKAFSEAHPKIAGNLKLQQGDAEDPLVARLLEGFAFLSGKIQYNLDQANQTITENSLDLLYPHYDRPIPAFSILNFEVDKSINASFDIQKNTELRTPTQNKHCTFRTCFDTELLPFNISKIKWSRHFNEKPLIKDTSIKSCLSIQLNCNNGNLSFKKVKHNKMRFFINLESHLAYKFYEILDNNIEDITISISGPEIQIIQLPKNNFRFIGFDEKESALEYPINSQKSYRLLSEYFAYPKKFLFFDIYNINQLPLPEDLHVMNINFFLNAVDNACEAAINDTSLLLNCCPIVNLFKKTSEVIPLEKNKMEYQLVADNDLSSEQIEIYSVESVNTTLTNENKTRIHITPYFKKQYSNLSEQHYLYWHTKQKPCWELGKFHLPGSETYMIFSQLNKNISSAEQLLLLSANLLCTNREFTLKIPVDGENPKLEFFPKNIEGIKKINCISIITQPLYRSRNRKKQMELLNHINITQLCYSNRECSKESLKNILRLYDFDDKNNKAIIEKGILSASTKTITKRNPNSLKQGFCQGIEYKLCLDEQYFSENDTFLFSKIIQYFLQKSCSINSFVQLILKSKQRGVIKTWKPLIGTKKIL